MDNLSQYMGSLKAKPEVKDRGIEKFNYPDLNMRGVIVRKLKGEVAGMYAWRLYRCTPKDGVTEFGRRQDRMKNYYVSGGYSFGRELTLDLLNKAVNTLRENWD